MTNLALSDLLLCISADNRMLHVGPAGDVLSHLAVNNTAHHPGHDRSPRSARLEFYDKAGRRVPHKQLRVLGRAELGVHLPDTLVLPGDDPAGPGTRGDRAGTARLLERIAAALDIAQAYLHDHPEAGAQGPHLPAVTEVPRPSGTYADVLQALADELAPLDPHVTSNRGNWFHNLWHAANGTS